MGGIFVKLNDEQADILVNEIKQLIDVYKQTGNLSELAQLIIGNQDNETAVIEAIRNSKQNQIYEMTKGHIEAEEFFKAFTINPLSIQNINITKKAVKKEKKEFLKTVMDQWANGRDQKTKLFDEFYHYLAEQGETISIDEYNPLKFFKGELGPQIKAIVDENALGTIGKCISYFDFEKQIFIFEGKRNAYFRLHNYEDVNEAFNLPREFLYEHGNGFGYHKQIRPQSNTEMFGGGRFIFREKEIYFFHESGDYGESHKEYIQHCIGKLKLNGKDYLQKEHHSLGDFFLRQTGLIRIVQKTIQNTESTYHNAKDQETGKLEEACVGENNQNSLFSEQNNEPEDDLPF